MSGFGQGIGGFFGGVTGGAINGFKEAMKSKSEKQSDQHNFDLDNIKNTYQKKRQSASQMYDMEIFGQQREHENTMNKMENATNILIRESEDIITKEKMILNKKYLPEIAQLDLDISKKDKTTILLGLQNKELELKIRKKQLEEELNGGGKNGGGTHTNKTFNNF